MTKVQCTPPLRNEKLEIWQKFLWQISHDQSLMYPPPRNEKLEIWQKFCMADMA